MNKRMRAIVTAAGEGKRLFPITRSYAKEMVTFCGTPILEYCINFLRDSGITDIIIVTGRKKAAIQDYMGSGELFNINISYLIQDSPKGLGDAVSKVEPYIDNENFVVLLGDTIIIEDNILKEMINIHQKNNASATILLEHVKDPDRYGVVKFENSSINNSKNQINQNFTKIISLYEKPVDKSIKEEFEINEGWYAIAGLYILNKDIFKFLRITGKDNNNEIQLTDAIKLSLEDGNIILGYELRGKRIDVGGWSYLRDERDFYLNMNNDQLDEIIKSRQDKIKYFNAYLKRIK